MKRILVACGMLLSSIPPAMSQVSVGIAFSLPGVSIGINLPVYPQLVLMPGYPVYYAPQLSYNLFFYDGFYWLFQGDNWYVSSWYNGPWGLVDRVYVPLYVLRIPVRYYQDPPRYFRSWALNEPPRWDEYWGPSWERQRRGWNEWDRRSSPPPAPLPTYQRQYSGDRYPAAAQQQLIQSQNYRYQPREIQVQQPAQGPSTRPAPSPMPAPEQRQQQQTAPSPDRGPERQDVQRQSPAPRQQAEPPAPPAPPAPRAQPRQNEGDVQPRSAPPPQAMPERRGPGAPDQGRPYNPRESTHEQPMPGGGQGRGQPGQGAQEEEKRGPKRNNPRYD